MSVDSHPYGMVIDFPYSSAWGSAIPHAEKFMTPIYPIKLIVDVGVDYGLSTLFLAHNCPGAKVIGVDNFCYEQIPDTRTSVAGLIEKYFPDDIDLWPIESGEAEAKFAAGGYGQIDVLHIDAGHQYEEVKRDYELWYPHVRKGGLIMFHDIVAFPDDVGKFFKEIDGRKVMWNQHPGLGACYKDVDNLPLA